MKAKTYESELPPEYRAVMTVDAKSKKVGIALNLAALGVMAAVIAIGALAVRPKGYFEHYSLLRTAWLLAALMAYIVCHELVHGAAYKLLTGRKLHFGMTLTVAYCGVPDIYVYRRTALLSLLAPFVVFSLLFGGLIFILQDEWDVMYVIVLLAVHIGGCAGDLFDAGLYLFKFRDPVTLMQDTGPKQTFYCKG